MVVAAFAALFATHDTGFRIDAFGGTDEWDLGCCGLSRRTLQRPSLPRGSGWLRRGFDWQGIPSTAAKPSKHATRHPVTRSMFKPPALLVRFVVVSCCCFNTALTLFPGKSIPLAPQTKNTTVPKIAALDRSTPPLQQFYNDNDDLCIVVVVVVSLRLPLSTPSTIRIQKATRKEKWNPYTHIYQRQKASLLD